MITTEYLDQLDALRAAGTPGPWDTDERRPADVVNHKGFPIAYAVTTLDRDADAALIVAAVNALPQLVGALRAVLELHVPDEDVDACRSCWTALDARGTCPTVRAITAALSPAEEQTL